MDSEEWCPCDNPDWDGHCYGCPFNNELSLDCCRLDDE